MAVGVQEDNGKKRSAKFIRVPRQATVGQDGEQIEKGVMAEEKKGEESGIKDGVTLEKEEAA